MCAGKARSASKAVLGAHLFEKERGVLQLFIDPSPTACPF